MEQQCPSCGGSGGGPFGRAGSAWDDESYVCPRCEGSGKIAVSPPSQRPGIVKVATTAEAERAAKRSAAG